VLIQLYQPFLPKLDHNHFFNPFTASMQLTGAQLIGFTASRQGNSTFTGIEAQSGSSLPPDFYEATPGEIDLAVQLAAKAFKTYSQTSGEQRAVFLERIGEEIMGLGDELIRRCMQETALPEVRLTGERGRTVSQLRLFATVLREGSWVEARIDTALPDRQPPRPDLRRMLIPLGPVGVFGASNFPLAFSVAGGDTASALAAGCPVVFKGHPAHPATSEMVGAAIVRAAQVTGMPEGVFSLVQGGSVAVGMALVQHPLIKAIGFTGSFRGGKALYDAAVRREEPIPVYAEMGSTNPVFVLPGIIREKGPALAEGLAASVTLGVGQFCTNPGLFVALENDHTTQFIERTGQALAGSVPGAMLTGNMLKAYREGIARLTAIPGTRVTAQVQAPDGRAGAVLLQTRSQEFIENPELAEEVFGPSTVAIVAPSPAEMMTIAEGLKGHLTATVHGTEEDLQEFQPLLQLLTQKVGRLIINSFPTGVEVSYAMQHGGPYPATTDSRSTSVGTAAIARFVRPLCFQGFPDSLLPDALKSGNPLGIWRTVNGEWTKNEIK
jgi:NADP-dependent aldehyde dehydrogenase